MSRLKNQNIVKPTFIEGVSSVTPILFHSTNPHLEFFCTKISY
nr:MAG TPA: hypothetical protein [Caudoviricetes sp.]